MVKKKSVLIWVPHFYDSQYQFFILMLPQWFSELFWLTNIDSLSVGDH